MRASLLTLALLALAGCDVSAIGAMPEPLYRRGNVEECRQVCYPDRCAAYTVVPMVSGARTPPPAYYCAPTPPPSDGAPQPLAPPTEISGGNDGDIPALFVPQDGGSWPGTRPTTPAPGVPSAPVLH